MYRQNAAIFVCSIIAFPVCVADGREIVFPNKYNFSSIIKKTGVLFTNFLNVECKQREGAPKALSIVLRFSEFLVSVDEQFHG